MHPGCHARAHWRTTVSGRVGRYQAVPVPDSPRLPASRPRSASVTHDSLGIDRHRSRGGRLAEGRRAAAGSPALGRDRPQSPPDPLIALTRSADVGTAGKPSARTAGPIPIVPVGGASHRSCLRVLLTDSDCSVQRATAAPGHAAFSALIPRATGSLRTTRAAECGPSRGLSRHAVAAAARQGPWPPLGHARVRETTHVPAPARNLADWPGHVRLAFCIRSHVGCPATSAGPSHAWVALPACSPWTRRGRRSRTACNLRIRGGHGVAGWQSAVHAAVAAQP